MRHAAALVFVAAVGLAACGGGGDRATTTTGLELAATGLGPLHLGATLAHANATGLIGATNAGCQLAGPGVLAAKLVGNVKGSVTFTKGVLSAIVIAGGARTIEGIHVGSTLDEVRAAYPAPRYAVTADSSTIGTFGIINVTVTHGGNPAFGMTVVPSSHTVQTLWIPAAQFCD